MGLHFERYPPGISSGYRDPSPLSFTDAAFTFGMSLLRFTGDEKDEDREASNELLGVTLNFNEENVFVYQTSSITFRRREATFAESPVRSIHGLRRILRRRASEQTRERGKDPNHGKISAPWIARKKVSANYGGGTFSVQPPHLKRWRSEVNV